MPSSLYETCLQRIMVVVFSVAKSWTCFVKYNSHDSLHARLIEGIGDDFFSDAKPNTCEVKKEV